MQRRRILVVDDDPFQRKLLKHMLMDNTVTLAQNGAEARALADANRFDLVLLDINLGPGEDGTQVLHALHETLGYERTKYIALTAYAKPGDRSQFLEVGFDDYIGKPFSRRHLLDVIARV